MARVVNSFALLGDEEGEDVTVLVEHLAKKVDVTAVDPAVQDEKKPAQNQSKSQQGKGNAAKSPLSEFGARSERGRGAGDRVRGPGRGGFGGNGMEHFGNEQDNAYRRNYGERSTGNGYDDAYRGRGRGRGGSRARGRGRGFNNEHVPRDEKEGSGGSMNNVADAADGWEQVPQTHPRGYGNDVNNNRDEERPFRNGNRNYAGEARNFRGGNNSYGYRPRKVMNYQKDEQLNNDEVKENVNGTDGIDANGVSNNAIAEGEASAVTEEPKLVGAEEKTPKFVGAEEKTLEEGVKIDDSAKKDEEEDDEKVMTLEEYQKLYAEKRKALQAMKIEERKVVADKDFEAMQMLEKKKEEILLKPETVKLKKKDSLEKDEKPRKTVSINEFLKPADGEEFVYRRVGRGRGRGGRGGDFRNGEHGFRNSGYPRGGGRGRDGPIIHIEDQGQFPVLKGAAPAVEAA